MDTMIVTLKPKFAKILWMVTHVNAMMVMRKSMVYANQFVVKDV